MLVDGAKYGDVEIPVFCYEPKLGARSAPAACAWSRSRASRSSRPRARRRSRTAWSSTPRPQRVHEAQRAVVEFLLINHPLDCPVCDKGGECPLQDITYGWGRGHVALHRAQAPLPQAARAVAADRDRPRALHPLLPLRALLAGDLRGLPARPAGARRARLRLDLRRHPYVAPFSGNITELCPVGALTSTSYRFRARPWDIEGAGTVCTLCPSQCNVDPHRPRRARHARARARQRRGRRRLAVRQGPLRVPARPRRRAHHAADGPRGRQAACPPRGRRRSPPRAARSRRRAPRPPPSPAARPPTRRRFLLQRLFREGLGSSNLAAALDARPPGRRCSARSRTRRCRRRCPTSSSPTRSLLLDCDPIDEATIWDLRIRKGVRRRGVKLAVASARPTALDPNAAAGRSASRPARSRPCWWRSTPRCPATRATSAAPRPPAGTNAGVVRDLAELLTDGGEDVVIVAGERLLTAGAAAGAAQRRHPPRPRRPRRARAC